MNRLNLNLISRIAAAQPPSLAALALRISRQPINLRSRQGLDAVWTLIILGVIAVLAALVFAIVPSLQSAGQKMKSTLDGAPW